MNRRPETESEVQSVRKWYDRIADDFQKRYEGGEGAYLAEFEDAVYSKMLDVRGKTVLDLGTGGGRHAFQFALIAKEVRGVDISEEMIRIASGKNTFPNLSFQVGDATKLGFPTNHFDVVLSAGMFEYLPDPSPFLEEIVRVLKPGGRLVFSCYQTPRMRVLRWLERKFVRIVFGKSTHRPANPYSAKISAKGSLFEKAQHAPSDLKSLLERAGFRGFRYRSTFLRFPSELYFWGASRQSGMACRTASRLNQAMGSLVLTKWMGAIMIVSAEKSEALDTARAR